MTARLLPLASLALGIALGVVAALWLVLWRGGAEPDEPAVTEPVPEYMRLFRERDWRGGYDGEAVGIG